jgi:phenylalanyl-tRNA synthetase beta chain
LLEKARYNVEVKGYDFICEYPAYRLDIFQAVDVIEDLLISYGFNKIEPQKIVMNVTGSERADKKYEEFVRAACVGLSLQEIQTFNLTSKEIQCEKMNLPNEIDSFVEISNPISMNYQIMRKRLSPSTLSFLSKNKNQEFPQNIFEIGNCLELNEKAENGVNQKTNLCVALTHSNVNFTEIKSIFVTLCEYLDLKYTFEKITEKEKLNYSFLGQNSIKIKVNGKTGYVGEIDKKVEENFGLKKPVYLFEFEL